MKKVLVTSVIALFAFSVCAIAAEKPNHGKCVSDCVQSFNKSLDDKGIDTDNAGTFTQKKCVEWCKNNPGQPYFWAVDTQTQPDNDPFLKYPGDACQDGSECLSGSCFLPPGLDWGYCE